MERITASDLQQVFADVADAGAYGCFEYQGIAVGLHSDEATLLDWFSKFFGGYFIVTASHQTDAVVYSTQDPDVFQRLKEWATSSDALVRKLRPSSQSTRNTASSTAARSTKPRARWKRTALSSRSPAGVCWFRLPAPSKIARRR